jgi:hypothetical protein
MIVAPPTSPRSPRSIWNNRVFVTVYTGLFVAVVVLASITVYYDLFPSQSRGTSGGTFTLNNVTLSFGGLAASNVSPAVSWCSHCWDGTYSEATPFQMVVGIALVGLAGSCSHLGQTVIYEVDVFDTTDFVIVNVTWSGTSLAGSGDLPVHLPYGNATACDSGINLMVTLDYIPLSPSNTSLALTVFAIDSTTVIPPP